jgi:hypothetical protein
MNVYTSDGLLVEQRAGADARTLAAEHGQQLISVYRLFLQLHHAGSGAMRMKDMLRHDAGDTSTAESSNGADKTTERRANNSSRGAAAAALTSNRRSLPLMPDSASTYSSSIAAVSAGTPYPMFLLSSNAIPETHRLRGFPFARTPSTTPGVLSKNNNRCCNGCEEIPLRWGLLTKLTTTTATITAAAAAASGGYGMGSAAVVSLHDKADGGSQRGSGDGTEGGSTTISAAATAAAQATATTEVSGDANGAPFMDRKCSPDAASVSPSAAAAGAGAAATVSAVSSLPRVFASGWSAAELQVHTTHRALICTATELPLGVDGTVEDGNVPLVFCCSVQCNAL